MMTEIWILSLSSFPSKSARPCTGTSKLRCVEWQWTIEQGEKQLKGELMTATIESRIRSMPSKSKSKIHHKMKDKPIPQRSLSSAGLTSNSYLSTWSRTPCATRIWLNSRRPTWQSSGWSSNKSSSRRMMVTFRKARKSTVHTWWPFLDLSPSKSSERPKKKKMMTLVQRKQTQLGSLSRYCLNLSSIISKPKCLKSIKHSTSCRHRSRHKQLQLKIQTQTAALRQTPTRMRMLRTQFSASAPTRKRSIQTWRLPNKTYLPCGDKWTHTDPNDIPSLI